ncbi:MAG: hypothetical protein ABL984_10020 [Pyrinomonadaceae bacterium]
MKRCPKCRRDCHDDTLFYCLDGGNALLEGPARRADTPVRQSSDDDLAGGIGACGQESPRSNNKNLDGYKLKNGGCI